MSCQPKVSVILAVYNGEEFLNECIHSIRIQTLSEFEFIIVDDASTDATPDILKRHAVEDSRIIILTNEQNKERSFSRNLAIKLAQSDLIAIMDADDVAAPTRLERQYEFMLLRTDVSLCGSFMSYLNERGMWSNYCDDHMIRAHMLFECPLAHPTVMFRRNIVVDVGGYDENNFVAEDYALWAKLADNANVHFANIPEVLVYYRTYPHLDRQDYYKKQRDGASEVHKKLLKRLNVPISPSVLNLHWLCTGYCTLSILDLMRAKRWLKVLLQVNESCHFFSHSALSAEIAERRCRLCAQTPINLKTFLRPLWHRLPSNIRSFVRSFVERVRCH
ncbi:glycosyltransferase family 2 protein [Desulfomicrobium salsuginis]